MTKSVREILRAFTAGKNVNANGVAVMMQEAVVDSHRDAAAFCDEIIAGTLDIKKAMLAEADKAGGFKYTLPSLMDETFTSYGDACDALSADDDFSGCEHCAIFHNEVK